MWSAVFLIALLVASGVLVARMTLPREKTRER